MSDLQVMPGDPVPCRGAGGWFTDMSRHGQHRPATAAVHVTADRVRRPICSRCGINHSHGRLVWADHDAVQKGEY